MTYSYHSGEIVVQEMTGERNTAVLNEQNISNEIPASAVKFLFQQKLCVLGWSDSSSNPWATVMGGDTGFASTDDARRTLSLALTDQHKVLFQTPPFVGAKLGDSIGVLFIELPTRRRLRINGHIAQISDTVCEIAVEQAYPNCPKYIQRRTMTISPAPSRSTPIVETGKELTDALRDWITTADTCFVASAHPDGPADASHRGGPRGFIELVEGVLHIPDYRGNSMFNTLGNFEINPHAGLCFLDFEANRQLQLTGDVMLELNGDDTNKKTGGTGRWWQFRPQCWIVSPLNLAFDWMFVDASPFNP